MTLYSIIGITDETLKKIAGRNLRQPVFYRKGADGADVCRGLTQMVRRLCFAPLGGAYAFIRRFDACL